MTTLSEKIDREVAETSARIAATVAELRRGGQEMRSGVKTINATLEHMSRCRPLPAETSFRWNLPAHIAADEAAVEVYYRVHQAERCRVDPLNDSYDEGADACAEIVDVKGVSRPLTDAEREAFMADAEEIGHAEKRAEKIEGISD